MNDRWDRPALAWWPWMMPLGTSFDAEATPPIPGGGILGDFGLSDASAMRLTQGGGLLSNLDRPAHASAGVEAPLMLAQGFSATSGAGPLDPALQYPDSARYWSALPPPSNPSDPSPAQGLYLPPAPQAPGWDRFPAPSNAGVAQPYPEPSTSSVGASTGPIDDDPFSRAALRTQQSVRPPGGRHEGAATFVLENYLPHIAKQFLTMPQRAFEASERLRLTGEYDPGPALEAALLTLGARARPGGPLRPGKVADAGRTSDALDPLAGKPPLSTSPIERPHPFDAGYPRGGSAISGRSIIGSAPNAVATGEPSLAAGIKTGAPAGLTPMESYLEPGSMRTPPGARGPLFDYSRLHEVPPVEQFNLPRYQSERGIPNSILALDNPEILKSLDRLVETGLERGGNKAFNLEPLRQHFLAELGPEKGQAMFKQFTDLLGATSPVSTDLAMLRNASYYDSLFKRGAPLPEPLWDPARSRLVLPESPPPPYGHIRQGLHAKKASEVLARGGLNPSTDAKIASVAEQFRGNQLPIPIDRHVARSLGIKDALGRPLDVLPRAGYGFAEELLQRQAAKMGIAPGQYQAALRAGAAEHTGLRSLEPILATLEKRLEVTAQKAGISKAEVLKRLIRDGYPLRSLAAAAGAEAVAPRQPSGTPEDDE